MITVDFINLNKDYIHGTRFKGFNFEWNRTIMFAMFFIRTLHENLPSRALS